MKKVKALPMEETSCNTQFGFLHLPKSLKNLIQHDFFE